MNNLALLAARKLMFLEVTEAAKYIGNVEPRTWRYYESGRSSIPPMIEQKMKALLQRRESLKAELKGRAEEHKKLGQGRQVLPFFVTFEQYKEEAGLDDLLEWRIDQSVKSSLYIEHLVIFY